MRDIAIIGGGASGIAAAITAAEAGARVTVFEAGKRIGHSVMVSGNGRCNWSNTRVEPGDYANAAFVARAFAACPPARVWQWFADLGLLSAEEDGRRYPASNKATSVLDVLRFRLDELGVELACERRVASVRPVAAGSRGTRWTVELEGGRTERFDAVVVAVGGGIARELLPAGYAFAKRRPRLCPIRTARDSVKGLDGVRVRGSATLVRDGREVAREMGEVQFRTFGVSGIGVFNLSRFARVGDVVRIDLLPGMDEAALAGELEARCVRFPQRPAERLLAGAVLPAVARATLRKAEVDPAAPLACGDAARLAACLKAFELEAQGFEEKSAQVRQGGVEVSQVDPATMESLHDAGLYVLGEALDVDGPCGGYNLHWAWTCGLLAGAAAAKAAPSPGTHAVGGYDVDNNRP